jgi:AcrR family transcriptional regulator
MNRRDTSGHRFIERVAATLLLVTGIHERRRALTKGERTRERLLRAGVDRFGTYGYRATSVSQLSRDAGLTPAAAYAYFEDKETFWLAAVRADLDALRAEITAQVAHSERPVIDSMLAMIEGLQGHALARRVMVEGSPQDLMMVLTHPLFAGTTRVIGGVLAARQAAGTLPTYATAEQLAVGIETIIFSLVLSVVRAGMEGAPDRVDAVLALLQAAAGGPPTPEERRR